MPSFDPDSESIPIFTAQKLPVGIRISRVQCRFTTRGANKILENHEQSSRKKNRIHQDEEAKENPTQTRLLSHVVWFIEVSE